MKRSSHEPHPLPSPRTESQMSRNIPAGFVLQNDGSYSKAKRKPLAEGDKDALALMPVTAGAITIWKAAAAAKSKTRLRQTKSLYDSELEKQWHDYLLRVKNFSSEQVRPKGIRLRLPGGVFYTPDFVWVRGSWPPVLYEVKGPKASKGRANGERIFKIVAGYWSSCFTFIFVWKDEDSGQWCEQTILP